MASVDHSAWDANAAMGQCSSTADYDKVSFRRAGMDPSLRSAHALPHHYIGRWPAPNADGVRAARSRFSQTQGLADRAAADRHLEAHMTAIQEAASADLPRTALVRARPGGYEVRVAPDGLATMTGHFAVFDEWAHIDSLFEGEFLERIAPGAFAQSFADHTPKVLFQHGQDPAIGDKVLGIPSRIEEDEQGAGYDVPLFDTSYNRDLIPGLVAGAYGASFRFTVLDEEPVWHPERSEYNPDGLPERTINRVDVAEFGPVTFPAYAGATAGVRSMTAEFEPDQIGRLARERPGELARRIEAALHTSTTNTTNAGRKPHEGEPAPPTEPKRFRDREEYLRWITDH